MDQKIPEIVADNMEVLFSESSETTTWNLYRDLTTKQMNLAIAQSGGAVVVSVANLRMLLNDIVPMIEASLPKGHGLTEEQIAEVIG